MFVKHIDQLANRARRRFTLSVLIIIRQISFSDKLLQRNDKILFLNWTQI